MIGALPIFWALLPLLLAVNPTDQRRSTPAEQRIRAPPFSPSGRVMVFAVQGEEIAGITWFARRPELFDQLGFARELVGDA